MTTAAAVRRRRSVKPRTLAAIAAAAIALAGCDGGSSAGGAQPSALSSASGSASGLAAWMEAVRCVRAHGHPNYPDPVEDGHGGWRMPQSAGTIDIPAPCDDLVRQAKATDRQGGAPSAEDIAKLRQFAKCMREHGVPNFPDPNSRGKFGEWEIGPQAGTPAQRRAFAACRQYLPPQVKG